MEGTQSAIVPSFVPPDADEHGSTSTCCIPPAPSPSESLLRLDIEHAFVENDPRRWSNARKYLVLAIISGASMISGLCGNIQNPANPIIHRDLNATNSQISTTLSLFFLAQGTAPLFWSAASELKGRKIIYLISVTLFMVSSAVAAISKHIGIFIGMRVVQGMGSSAVMSIGAATLADIFDPQERGRMMGIFYIAPLFGPSIGPLIGGGLTQAFGWRAVFWFLVIWGGIMFSAFLFLFKDTFRKERSLAYQNVLKRHLQQEKPRTSERKFSEDAGSGVHSPATLVDVEKQVSVAAISDLKVKLTISDVNPFPPNFRIFSCKHNVAILIPNSLLFGFNISLAYTCGRTLSIDYHCDAMMTGLVLLSFGIGSMLGSILGGRWSDRTLARLKATNGGVSYPEMRLETAKYAMLAFPLVVIGYAWGCQEHVHIAALCVMLVLCGFFSIWIYVGTLAYIVDSNVGQSSSAVAASTACRGITAFVAAEFAVQLQDTIGDGGLYMLWTGLLFLGGLLLLLVLYKGKQWREAAADAEETKSQS